MSKCGRASVGAGDRWNAQRVSIRGTSNERPLYVTSSDASSNTSARRRSMAGSPDGPATKNCRTRSDPLSNHAQPTRNASVPAPPLRPVVSMSKNTTRRGQSAYAAVRGSSRRTGADSSGTHDLRRHRRSIARPHAIDHQARAVVTERPAEIAGRGRQRPFVERGGVGFEREFTDRRGVAASAGRSTLAFDDLAKARSEITHG